MLFCNDEFSFVNGKEIHFLLKGKWLYFPFNCQFSEKVIGITVTFNKGKSVSSPLFFSLLSITMNSLKKKNSFTSYNKLQLLFIWRPRCLKLSLVSCLHTFICFSRFLSCVAQSVLGYTYTCPAPELEWDTSPGSPRVVYFRDWQFP